MGNTVILAKNVNNKATYNNKRPLHPKTWWRMAAVYFLITGVSIFSLFFDGFIKPGFVMDSSEWAWKEGHLMRVTVQTNIWPLTLSIDLNLYCLWQNKTNGVTSAILLIGQLMDCSYLTWIELLAATKDITYKGNFLNLQYKKLC